MCYNTNFGVYNVKSTNPALADDIACLSSSPVGLQEMLNVAFRYSCLWQFSFNALKSSIVIFGKNITPTQHEWKLGEESIPINDKYKHLGIIQHSPDSSQLTVQQIAVTEEGKLTSSYRIICQKTQIL